MVKDIFVNEDIKVSWKVQFSNQRLLSVKLQYWVKWSVRVSFIRGRVR